MKIVLALFGLERELHDGVASARLGVCAGGAHAPRRGAVLDEALDEVHRVHLELLEPDDAHLVPRVLADDQLPPPVQEVVHLPAVNLEEGDV